MADNTNKVTIDESRYDELKSAERELKDVKYQLNCERAKLYTASGLLRSISNECDDLKAKVNAYEPKIKDLDAVNLDAYETIAHLRKERDELKAKLATSQNYEDVIAAKDREIAIVTEDRNRLNAKVNELMKELEAEQSTNANIGIVYAIVKLEGANQ